MEAVAHEKQLHSIMKAALKRFQKGLNADPDDKILKEVYPNMIYEFKTTIRQVYNPVHRANRGKILNCVEDPEAECIWNRDDEDDGDDDEPVGTSIQKEELKHCDMDEFIESLETPQTDAQA